MTKQEVIKIVENCRNEFNLIIEAVVTDSGFNEGKEFDEIIRRLNLVTDNQLKAIEKGTI